MKEDKKLWESKKATLALVGIGAILLLGLSGYGAPAAYGAIGLIVSVACGAQGMVDYKNQG